MVQQQRSSEQRTNILMESRYEFWRKNSDHNGFCSKTASQNLASLHFVLSVPRHFPARKFIFPAAFSSLTLCLLYNQHRHIKAAAVIYPGRDFPARQTLSAFSQPADSSNAIGDRSTDWFTYNFFFFGGAVCKRCHRLSASDYGMVMAQTDAKLRAHVSPGSVSKRSTSCG